MVVHPGLGLGGPLRGAGHQADLTQLCHAHAQGVHKVVVLALGEHAGLLNDLFGPIPVRGVDHPLGEQVLHGVEPGQLVEVAGVNQLHAPILMAVEPAHLLGDTVAAGFVLDQEVINLEAPAGLGHLGHKVV